MLELLLASASPRRAELLHRAQIAFRVVPSLADEASIQGRAPVALALARARLKAHGVERAQVRDGLVLGADTVVWYRGEAFGKPRNDADAVRILTALAGTRHWVSTAQVLWDPRHDVETVAVAEAQVELLPLNQQEIAAYVATGEPAGKAGAFALQGQGRALVRRVWGEDDAVVGLSVSAVRAQWRRISLHPLGRAPTMGL